MKRELGALVVLAGLLGAGWLGYRALFGGGEIDALTVVEVDGAVRRRVGGKIEAAEAGDRVGPGDGVEAGPDGTAVLALGADARVTLRPESSVSVVDVNADGVRLALEGGRVQATVREGGPAVAVRAGDREVVARDADVTIARAADGTVAVAPERGEVALTGFGVDSVDASSRVVAPPGRAATVVAANQDVLLNLAVAPPTRTRDRAVAVRGRTEPGSVVRVTGGSAPVETRADADGAFAAEVPLTEGANRLEVAAVNPLGGRAVVVAEVERDTTAPGIQVEIR